MYLHQVYGAQLIFSSAPHPHFNILHHSLQLPHTFPCVVQHPEHNMKPGLGSSATSDTETLQFRAIFSDEPRLLDTYERKSIIAFLVMQMAMPKMNKPNFFWANIHLKNHISNSIIPWAYKNGQYEFTFDAKHMPIILEYFSLIYLMLIVWENHIQFLF